jgi:hypothetical protein
MSPNKILLREVELLYVGRSVWPESFGKFRKPLKLHIDTKYFFLREKNGLGAISIVYTPTKEMLADLFTKPINGEQFQFLRDTIMNV